MFLSAFTEISVAAWVMAATAVFLMGISKAGLKGMSIFNVTLMALAFGSRASTGLFIPLLIVGDMFAVVYYNRHTQWKYILKFIPWMIAGILIGVLIGKDLPEREFKWGMVVVIFLSLGLLLWWDRRKSESVPSHWVFAGSMGVMAGICTMIGNLAGAFTNIFFLAMRLPKNEFVGTAAWLFFITNLFKLPFHIFVWNTISAESLLINLKLLPAIFVGLFLGVFLVKKINEKNYKRFILVVTAIGAIAILFR
ncbi:sulfite exporter TauE/SafE family protein [Flagellimonas taeanensis]|uniref:sulfite exporter TauE/SafE family protein n=1 Tax=Flavobacteriaceae TaxID=49546 RepID=UPI000E68DE3E|nr:MULTISPECIES: sulfite exporter TauE/SafE family protein [Allomuricauda]MDC6385365.1 sulfite exporter TauE/SafE family protein [Muricauda sp. SK9]RIV53117.1 sulfite exporter TauE/SafE family protein [Allomuricauda taeanensis]